MVVSHADQCGPQAELLETRYLWAFGQIDTNWGTSGRIITDVGSPNVSVNDLVPSGNKFYAAGDTSLVRYLADGSLDRSFGKAGIANLLGDSLVQTTIGDDGSIYALFSGAVGTRVLKLDSTGKRDNSFGSDGIATVTADAASIFSPQAIAFAGGKLLVGGARQTVPGNSVAQVYRLTGKGSIDTAFGKQGAVLVALGLPSKTAPKIVDHIGAIRALDGGQIVLVGQSISWYPNQPNPQLDVDIYGKSFLASVRLTGSGHLDTTYGTQGIARVSVLSGQLIFRSVDEQLKFQ